MDTHLTMLRKRRGLGSLFHVSQTQPLSYHQLQTLVSKYFERKGMGKTSKIKVKKAFGKDIFKTVELTLDGQDIPKSEYQFEPEYRGTY